MESPAIIVARFLRANNYNATLEAFLSEAGLPQDAGLAGEGALTIEKILEEKNVFDLSLSFEKIGVNTERAWYHPAPEIPFVIHTLPSSANLLHVSIEKLKNGTSDGLFQLLCATTADRRLNLLVPNPTFTLFKSKTHLHDSPILSCVTVGEKYFTTLSTSMSGQIVLYNHEEEKVIGRRRDHEKYVVKATTWETPNHIWIATAGWDAKVFLYLIQRDARDGVGTLNPPVASIKLLTNPETVTFVKHPDSETPILLITRRDSTSLYYYAFLASVAPSDSAPAAADIRLIGVQNLVPHSNAWIAFSPSSVAICPTDPTLLAVATSAVPHLKLILVRLLFPPLEPASTPNSEPSTQAEQTQRKLATQDQEEAAIILHVNTMAPQTPYSTPQVCWRPDGSGVWVNGEDGALRGLEAKTGKVVTTLTNGHEAGSKIRSVWAGLVKYNGEEEEWVVSGGFDKRLIVWRPGKEGTIHV